MATGKLCGIIVKSMKTDNAPKPTEISMKGDL